MDYQTFYTSIDKPFFAPPDWVFGLAWGIIYPLIFIAIIVLAYKVRRGKIPSWLLLLLLFNMALNVAFTPLQLQLQNIVWATIDIVALLITLIWFEWKIYPYSKTVFILLLPYLLWGAFATVLQLSITFLN